VITGPCKSKGKLIRKTEKKSCEGCHHTSQNVLALRRIAKREAEMKEIQGFRVFFNTGTIFTSSLELNFIIERGKPMYYVYVV
jgi:hypothetical protein